MDSIAFIIMIKPFKNPILITKPFLPPIQEYVQKLNEIWASRWLTNMGSQHLNLENDLKKYLNVEHLSLFCNGTIALQVALKCLEISGEVITTPFTFPATINSIIVSNCKPIFCDISPNDFNVDAEKIEDLITEKTTAIMPFNVFGNPCRR